MLVENVSPSVMDRQTYRITIVVSMLAIITQ